MGEPEKVLTFENLAEKGWPHTRGHTQKLVRSGKFPKPFKAYDGGRRNLWLEADVDAFLALRANRNKAKK